MTVTIKVPESISGITPTTGTKVITEDGRELQEVTRVRIDWGVGQVAEATIDIAVTPGMTLDGVHMALGTETLEQIASMHGYELTPIGGTE